MHTFTAAFPPSRSPANISFSPTTDKTSLQARPVIFEPATTCHQILRNLHEYFKASLVMLRIRTVIKAFFPEFVLLESPDPKRNYVFGISSNVEPPIELLLDELDQGSTDPNALRDGETFVVKSVVHLTMTTNVVRVEIGGRPYVVKVLRHRNLSNRLRDEANLYRTKLKHLQGDVVPKFYGVLEGKDLEGKDVCCLVLEDCGDYAFTLEIKYHVQESIRVAILTALGKMHLTGLSFFEDEAKFVLKNDSYIIVGFGGAKKHTCGWKGNLHYGETYPDLENFGCGDLYETCKEMGIWKLFKNSRKIQGDNYRVKEDYFPTQKDVDDLFPKEYEYSMAVETHYPITFLKWLGKELPVWRKAHPNAPVEDFLREKVIPSWWKNKQVSN
ncbi:hypothetical protein SCHPADRAFT_907751 [Schizopora paradoxa]|uniref:Protein kinase domain-containing protein n=1 Tax=Schizopora paradoxa TaxID=27342 RepID=A0A0H2RJ37_9AGAM|nr:hypothetical protein SCHPADRAFT_907751 [Schizopora paradoxa]